MRFRLPSLVRRYELQLLCSAILLCFYAYFYTGASWNQNSRFDLTRAIVEQHTVRIDSFHKNTGDKALYNGHYYSDKAPGLALAAVPVWAAVRSILEAAGKTTATERALTFGLYTAGLITVALPTVIGLSLLLSLAMSMGASPGGAVFGMLALGLGTPIWAYATLFWGHAAAGSFLVFAFAAAFALRKPNGYPLLLGFIVGGAAGWATVIEYPAGPMAALLAAYAAFNAWRSHGTTFSRVITGIICGAILNMLVLGLYHYLAFGSAFSIGYAHNVNFPEMRTNGFFGVTHPSFKIIRELLFGWQRGLLPLAPVLIFLPIGLHRLLKKRRLELAILVAIPLYYLLLNASYVSWDGGFSYGPRHLAAGIFFLVVPLSLAWTRGNRLLRISMMGSAVAGAVMALMAVSTLVIPPTAWAHPIVELSRAFFRDQIPLNDGTNVGLVIGLEGHASLIPLVVFAAFATFALWKMLRRSMSKSVLQTNSGTILVEGDSKAAA
jgi:hypothetical protein